MKIQTTRHLWNSDEKMEARSETIINTYREIFERKCVPHNKQYWTLCGDLSNGDCTPNPRSEYCQIIEEGLIQPNQFFGVDNNISIIEKNKLIYPQLNFYANDFLKQLKESSKSNFDPAVVNADYTCMTEKASTYSAKILYFLSHKHKNIKNVMVVFNMMLNNPYRGIGDIEQNNWYDFCDSLSDEPRWQQCNSHWEHYPSIYKYYGNGLSSKTYMCTQIFYNRS